MENLIKYFNTNIVSTTFTVIIILLYFIGRILIYKLIRTRTIKGKIAISREIYIRKSTHLILVVLLISILGTIWEISIQGLSFYFASIFAVVGVSLFATWSVLSNVTSSIILFFFFPYRIGQLVKIIDGDNSIEGKITDLNLFYLKIKTIDNQLVAYPNSVAIQKPIMLRDKENLKK